MLTERAAAGLKQLDEAAEALKQRDAKEEESDAEELGQRIDLLRAFGEVFAAFGKLSDSQASRDRLIDACGGLAMYFDDTEKAVAESAKFWQGAAYRRAGKPARALQVLRPALATPASGRIGFLARLERCRALADQGEFVAAIALAMRLASRVDSWFDGEDEGARKRAGESIRGLRVELQRAWAAKLRDEGKADRAAEAEAQARKLEGDSVDPVQGAHGLELTEAIAGVPEIKPKEQTPATQEDEP